MRQQFMPWNNTGLAMEFMEPGGRLNLKMSSYQYTDSHVKDKTVLKQPPGVCTASQMYQRFT